MKWLVKRLILLAVRYDSWRGLDRNPQVAEDLIDRVREI